MSKAPTRADRLRELAEETRQGYAAEQLTPDAILAEAAKMAAAGFTSMRITFDKALDISGTEAAGVLGKVAAREGLRLEWTPRTIYARDSGNGCDERVCDLVISW